MNIVAEIKSYMAEAWLPNIYSEKVRSGRTRAMRIEIPERENAAEIHYTLLGIELKVGKRRIACPDLATARYLRVFARAGVTGFALPYDITQIAPIADELEISWQRMLIYCSDLCAGDNQTTLNRRRRFVIKALRQEVLEIGAGSAMPAFRQSTTQRS